MSSLQVVLGRRRWSDCGRHHLNHGLLRALAGSGWRRRRGRAGGYEWRAASDLVDERGSEAAQREPARQPPERLGVAKKQVTARAECGCEPVEHGLDLIGGETDA